jgi:hypothetical protein
MIAAYLAGNVGSMFMMEAATQANAGDNKGSTSTRSVGLGPCM